MTTRPQETSFSADSAGRRYVSRFRNSAGDDHQGGGRPIEPHNYSMIESTCTVEASEISPPGKGAISTDGWVAFASDWSRTEAGTPYSSIGTVSNKARAKMVDKVRSSVGLAQNIAEFRQTWSTLVGLAKALVNPVGAFRDIAIRYAGRKPWVLRNMALKDLSDLWLAFHFGLEPLYKDIQTAMDLLLSPEEGYKWKHVIASATASCAFADKRSDTYYDTTNAEQYHLGSKWVANVRPKNPSQFSREKWGLANFGSVAWELVPYSFVVDWLLPVGQVISSITDLQEYELDGGYSSSYGKMTSVVTVGGSRAGYTESSTTRTRAVRMQRTVWASLPGVTVVPQARFVPFDWSKTRLATAFALLTSQLLVPLLSKRRPQPLPG